MSVFALAVVVNDHGNICQIVFEENMSHCANGQPAKPRVGWNLLSLETQVNIDAYYLVDGCR